MNKSEKKKKKTKEKKAVTGVATTGEKRRSIGCVTCVCDPVTLSCLSQTDPDQRRREKDKKEKKKETKEEKKPMRQPYGESFLSQNLFPDIPRAGDAEGGGVRGCIVKSSQHAGGLCLQVKPRERERQKKTEERSRTRPNKTKTITFSEPPTPHRQKSRRNHLGLQERQLIPRNKRDKQAASCAVNTNSNPENKKGQFEKDSSSHITCPNRTLSREELSKNTKPETQTKQQKPRRGKTGSISCCW